MFSKSLTIAALAGVLASGLAAAPADAGTAVTAAHQHNGGSPSSAPSLLRSAPSPSATQQAMLMARAHWLSKHAGVGDRAAIAAGLRSAVAAAGRANSALTGVVRGLGGQPVAGACVTATGPSGTVVARSRANGRYILPGLRSGDYAVYIGTCAGTAATASAAPQTYVWPQLPATVALGTGQTKALPEVTAIPSARAAAKAMRPGTSASKTGTGGISGRVTGGGQPLKGICVAANRVGGGQGEGAVTSKTGRYHITGLKPGRYQVEFGAEFGCGNSGNWLDQWYPDINSLFPTTKVVAIRVRAGGTKTGINAHLKLGGEISGTTRTRSGKPLGNICIDVQGRIPGGFVGFGFRSGRAGRYALHGLFSGRYTVAFSTDCSDIYAPQWWRLRTSQAHATPIKIKGADIVRHIDAALDRGATISGTVRAANSAGKPLAGICVSADSNRGDSADAVTRKDGTYRLTGLAGGRYAVDFDPSCFGQSLNNFLPQHRSVTVKRAGSRTGVNALLQEGAGFSGVVTGPHGHRLEGVCIQAVGTHGNAFAETDFDGSYSFAGLRPGSYTVQFTGCDNSGSVAPQYYNNEPNSGSADPITLTAGQITTGIDAAMRPGATISGVVTDASGHQLSDVCVGIADQSEVAFGPEAFENIQFTSAGKYSAMNLAPGLYQVSFGCGGGKYVSHWYLTDPRNQSPDLLSIPVGRTSGINGIMRPAGSIAGTVTTKAGRPARATCMYLVDARSGIQVLSSVFQGFVEQGRYKLTGLAPGSYKAFFYGCGANYASQWYHGRSTERNADLVGVRARHVTANIDASLAVGGSMSGQVVALATGKPVRNECVDAFDQAAQSFGFAQTDKTGHYTMHGMATGRYTVSFSRCYAKGPNLAGSTRPGLVRVTAPHTTAGINAKLGAGGTVSGSVTAGSQPRPQIGTCVELIPLSPTGAFGFAETGLDGTFTAPGIAAGQYQVNFNDPTCFFGVPSLASQWYNGQPSEATADTITVTAGSTTSGIDANLQPFGTITGTVTGPGQAAVAGECVMAIPIGKDFAGFFPPEVAITTTTGSYSLLDVQPGRYKVKFRTGCGDAGFKTQWWQNAGSAATATVITVGAGAAVTGIDAALTH